jgi:hypothetical protein
MDGFTAFKAGAVTALKTANDVSQFDCVATAALDGVVNDIADIIFVVS